MDKHSLDTLSHKGKDPDATSGEKLELAIKVVELIDDVVKLSALKRRQLHNIIDKFYDLDCQLQLLPGSGVRVFSFMAECVQ